MLDNLKPIDVYFLKHDEPIKSCLQFLRGYILAHHTSITETWKYGVPFYCYNSKRFCYLWVDKKRQQPYIGIVNGHQINHPNLLAENRTRMKILLIDANEDMPIEIIDEVLNAAIALV
jgi:hypothetical protein